MFEVSDDQADLILSKFKEEHLDKNAMFLSEGKQCEKLAL